MLDLTGAVGQRLIVSMAEPGTSDHDAMVLLDRADLTASVPVSR
jgi:hypothetical protein